MNEDKLKNTWKSYQSQLESALAVNRSNTIEITKLKVSSQLATVKPYKWFAIACGIVWCAILFLIFGMSLLHRPLYLPFLLFMGGLALINAIGVGIYIHHLVLIEKIDSSEDVVSAQRDLARLKKSTLNVTRILILSIPFYVSLHLFLVQDPGWLFWAINFAIVAVSIVFTVWLFVKIDERNRDEKWFRFLFGDREWSGVTRSIDLLQQIEELESGH